MLRKRLSCPDYKEKKESDIPASYLKKIQSRTNDLFPIEVIEEDPDLARYKVHYIGNSSVHVYDEWKEKDTIIIEDIRDPNPDDPNPENPMCCDQGQIEHFSLYYELATRIKTTLNSSRKESPTVRIDLPFDRIEFDGGLRVHGVKKCCIRGIQRYTLLQYLNLLLGVNWHFRGINTDGVFCYVVLSTVEFHSYHRRSLKEFVPSRTVNGEVKEIRPLQTRL